MIESKSWNWNIVHGKKEEVWTQPSIESYYLLHRWKQEEKNTFLDLGCGIGRHTVLFAQNGFKTSAFDLSENAIQRTREWTENLNLEVEFKVGDMLNLPYKEEEFDSILCRNVISHTDTEGIIRIISEIKRVLKPGGECYITLGSKDTWGWKQKDWPLADENTRIRMDQGPERGIPHFYADYDLILKLFHEFSIELLYKVEEFSTEKDKTYSSYHYHILIRKI